MKLPCHPNRQRALTLMEVIVVVAVLVCFVAMIMLHKLGEAKAKACRIKCIGNNKQVGLAIRIFGNDNDDKYPYFATNSPVFGNETDVWKYFVSMSNELGSPKILMCPADQERRNNMASDFSAANYGLQFQKNQAASYFIGLDADERRPFVLLSGDRNLETNAWNFQGSLMTFRSRQSPNWTSALHGYAGNISQSDGSVLQMTTVGLQATVLQALKYHGLETNRLLMPR